MQRLAALASHPSEGTMSMSNRMGISWAIPAPSTAHMSIECRPRGFPLLSYTILTANRVQGLIVSGEIVADVHVQPPET